MDVYVLMRDAERTEEKTNDKITVIC